MSFSSNPELLKRGKKVYEDLYAGTSADQMTEEYHGKSDDFAGMALEWCIGGLMGRPGLDYKSRELVALTLCAADGRLQGAVLAHAEACLKVGATKKEVYEAILMITWYAGAAPVSLALSTLNDFFGDEELA